MILHKLFIAYFTVLLTNCVTCDDAEEVKRRGLLRASQSYLYNHPPLSENYANIPVSIVYDKVVDRANRKHRIKNTFTTMSPTKNDQQIQEDVANTKAPKDVKDIENSRPTLDDSKKINMKQKVNVVTIDEYINSTGNDVDDINPPKSRNIKLEYKIPVSVVYDEEPVIVKYTLKTRTRQQPVQRRRKPTTKPKSQSESDTVIDNEKTSVILTQTVVKETTTSHSIENVSTLENVVTAKANESLNQNNLKSDMFDASRYNNSNKNIRKQSVNSETNSLKLPTEKVPQKKREHGEPDPIVPIVTSENHVYSQNGEFKYSYEGGDGTIAFSKGQLKTFDDEVKGEAVEGGFSYKDKDGNDFSLSYTADENGYRPVGAHLPTPPPIPPAIARALEYLATKTTPEPFTESLDDN